MSLLTGFRILVVEDESDLRSLFLMKLKKLGAEVFEAENGAEGFQIVLKEHPDAVLSDVRMPIASGWDLLKSVIALGNDAPPVFLLSGDINEFSSTAQEKGAAGLFHKPMDIEEAVRQIAKTLSEKNNTRIK